MKLTQTHCALLGAILLAATADKSVAASGMGTAFTYQGRLAVGTSGANGSYDLKFSLYDASGGGTLLGNAVTNTAVQVSNGSFQVGLDFGAAAFNGDARWLEIGVRTNGSGSFSLLAPRQVIAPAPYALFAPAAATASTASNVVLGAVGAQNLNTLVNPAPGQVLTYDGNSLTWTSPTLLSGAWALGGNGGTTPAMNFLGTTDNQPLNIRVNGQQAARFEPTLNGAPNLVCGANNSVLLSSGVTIGGGSFNAANAVLNDSPGYPTTNSVAFATISGGKGNAIAGYGEYASIGGGYSNSIVGGPFPSTYTNLSSMIGGGFQNTIYSPQSAICGGELNGIGIRFRVDNPGYGHFIGGGNGNWINYENSCSLICGGANNGADSSYATIAGGRGNEILWVGPSWGNTIGGGTGNTMRSMDCSTISGGADNSIAGATEYAVIGGGESNVVSGAHAVVPGGFNNTAEADYSFAAGNRAKAIHPGSFVWAGGNTTDYTSDADNTFNIYAAGGVLVHYGGQNAQGFPLKWIVLASRQPDRVINVFNGAYLSSTGVWTDNSDRNAKHNFTPVDGKAVLAQLAELPITSWSYKNDDAVRHIGPVAQDFYAAFEVGQDNTHIAPLDSAGVALAAIQGLNQVVQEKDTEIKELKKQVDELKLLVNQLVQRSNGAKQ